MLSLVVVQSEMAPGHYRDEAAFRTWLAASVAPARRTLVPEAPALVAFPELIGLPLLIAGAPSIVRRCRTWMQAGALLAGLHLRHLRAGMRRYGIGWKRALLLALSRRHIHRIYCDTFSDLARTLGATVVAGSAPIEGPAGEVSNTCCVFGPDGRLLGRQRKVHLLEPEGPAGLDLVPGPMGEIQAIDTPAGRVGVAICLDAFDVDTSSGEPRPQASVVARLAGLGAEILVQPSCNPKPWTPAEAAGWQEGIHRRMLEHPGFRRGLNPMMTGRVLDLAAEGESTLLGPGGRVIASAGTAAGGDLLVAVSS